MGIDALPFCSLRLNAGKPLPDKYPKEINTLGDHIRARRIDLRLLQKEVAEKIGVDETTIINWERRRTAPGLRFIARIIEFLGYDPIPEPESFPERLKAYRYRRGLSQKKLAIALEIDPSTITNWEVGRHTPSKQYLRRLEEILN